MNSVAAGERLAECSLAPISFGQARFVDSQVADGGQCFGAAASVGCDFVFAGSVGQRLSVPFSRHVAHEGHSRLRT